MAKNNEMNWENVKEIDFFERNEPPPTPYRRVVEVLHAECPPNTSVSCMWNYKL